MASSSNQASHLEIGLVKFYGDDLPRPFYSKSTLGPPKSPIADFLKWAEKTPWKMGGVNMSRRGGTRKVELTLRESEKLQSKARRQREKEEQEALKGRKARKSRKALKGSKVKKSRKRAKTEGSDSEDEQECTSGDEPWEVEDSEDDDPEDVDESEDESVSSLSSDSDLDAAGHEDRACHGDVAEGRDTGDDVAGDDAEVHHEGEMAMVGLEAVELVLEQEARLSASRGMGRQMRGERPSQGATRFQPSKGVEIKMTPRKRGRQQVLGRAGQKAKRQDPEEKPTTPAVTHGSPAARRGSPAAKQRSPAAKGSPAAKQGPPAAKQGGDAPEGLVAPVMEADDRKLGEGNARVLSKADKNEGLRSAGHGKVGSSPPRRSLRALVGSTPLRASPRKK